ncbi:MAG: Diaminopimelate epimerase, partial [Desulfonauticus sp. 38_4375]
QVVDRKKILLRTYERGVEVETYACGTGAAATAYVAFNLGLVDSTVELITSGQEKLIISIERENLFLQGKAVLVYKGYLNKQILTS